MIDLEFIIFYDFYTKFHLKINNILKFYSNNLAKNAINIP